MHGGSVIGASPGATGAAVVTVQGDGVIVYDVETQVRILAARRLVERDRTPSPCTVTTAAPVAPGDAPMTEPPCIPCLLYTSPSPRDRG